MPTPLQPAHWSKDFVEHLRTVHFALIALCVGLIVLATFHNKSQIELAHDQLLEILTVINNWNPELLEAEATTQRKKLILEQYKEQFVLNDDNTVSAKFDVAYTPDPLHDKDFKTVTPRFDLSNLLIQPPAGLVPNATYGVPAEINKPTNIKSFEKVWDTLLKGAQVSFPVISGDCTATISRADSGELDKMQPLKCKIQPTNTSPQTYLSMNLLVDYGMYSENLSLSAAEKLFTNKPLVPTFSPPPNIVVNLPVSEIRFVEFDSHKALIQCSTKWEQKYKRAFKDAFRELSVVDAPFEDTDIASAELILDAEAKRTGDAFEAVGLKIPAEIAVRCGVLLILGVQLYMLIHLREFGSRHDRDAGFEVAWIGVYFSTLARVIFFVSLLVLPACAVVFLSIRGLTTVDHRRLAWGILVASNTASCVLSYFIFKAFPQPPTPALAADTLATVEEEPKAETQKPDQTEQKFE